MDLRARLLGLTAFAVLGYIGLVYGSCASDPDCHFRLCAGGRSLCGIDHAHVHDRQNPLPVRPDQALTAPPAAPTGTTMTEAERKQINQRIALLERASALFDRFGSLVPVAIAFLNHWPTEVQLYPQWQVGESWRFFLSLYLYWLASLALGRAITFAKGSIEP